MAQYENILYSPPEKKIKDGDLLWLARTNLFHDPAKQ